MTSLDPKYIEMYAKVKKIQDGWKPEVGDSCWDTIEKRIVLILPDNIEEITAFCNYYIFLPSTEQMAEMWHPTPGGIFIIDLARFTENSLWKDNYKGFNPEWPLNIIVLAFIMHDLHSKTWCSEREEWVKNNG